MTAKIEKAIDVFIRYNQTASDFLHGAKKPKVQYDNPDFSLMQYSSKSEEKRRQIFLGDEFLEMKMENRYKYVDQHYGSKFVDFDNLEKLLMYENEIICIDFDFNIGSLKNLYHSQFEIQKYVFDYICNNEDEAVNEARQYVSNVIKKINKIETEARNGAIIRIWNAAQSNDILGLGFLMNKLNNVDCRIIKVTLPYEYTTPGGEKKTARGWGTVPTEEICAPFSHSTELSAEERNTICERWKRFVKENATLRTLVDGKVRSVEDDYYHEFILAHIPEGEFETISVVEELLVECDEYLPDYYWTNEIGKLLDEGLLENIGPGIRWGRDNCKAKAAFRKPGTDDIQ